MSDIEIKINDEDSKIKNIINGTVLDHLNPGSALSIIEILDLKKGLANGALITIGINYRSTRYSRKDMVKIENKYLTQEETDKLSIESPHATIVLIRNGKPIEKRKVEIPDVFEGVIKCPNPNCVTNNERNARTRFYTISREPLVLKCEYCERPVKREDINYAKKQFAQDYR